MGSELQTAAEYLDELLHLQPALMLFLIIGLGYLLGNIRIGGFSFGPVAGVLFAGLFLGHFGFRITPGAQAVGFAMFIFSVGYQAGPRFFAVLRQDGLKYFSLAVVVAACGFSIAAGWAWYMLRRAGKVRPIEQRTLNLTLIGTAVAFLAVWAIRLATGTLPPV